MTYEYDVAFSFLSIDESIASDLNDRLKPTMRTFLYTEHRKAMLGPGGYSKYGRIFRSDARTVVIIHREGWGDRGYTAVEGGAIERRVDAEGLGFLFVVVAPTSTRTALPPWVPPSHIYCELPTFSIDAAAACIREHARRAGTEPKIPTAAEMARAQRAAEARAKRQESFRSTHARDAATAEFPKLYDELQRIVADAPESFQAPTFDPQRQQITVSMKGQTYPQLMITLNLASGGRRLDEEMRVIIFPNEPILYREPHSRLYRAQYQIAIEGDADDDPPGWRLRHSDGRLLSNAAVAEREMAALVKARGSDLDQRERAHAKSTYRPRSPWS